MRQIGLLFGVSHSAAHRVIDTLGPLLALAPALRRPGRPDRDRRRDVDPDPGPPPGRAEQNCRYSTNVQIAIDASTRLVIAVGDPQPGNRNDTIVYRASGIDQKLNGRPVMADGGYQGNREVIIPYSSTPTAVSCLPGRKTSTPGTASSARRSNTPNRMKCFKILGDYRRAVRTFIDTASGIHNLHNIMLAG
ncbi:transposase family protein [Micromonospora sp. NPDC047707]|uniref:transposase family protein n=1 Tax=Micromonospora sp. NPDC047707 TaxID=3154498 RepID=UPI0034561EDF